MIDLATATLAQLRAELDNQAGLCEAAAKARAAVADEIRRRDVSARAAAQVSALSTQDKEALYVALVNDPAVTPVKGP